MTLLTAYFTNSGIIFRKLSKWVESCDLTTESPSSPVLEEVKYVIILSPIGSSDQSWNKVEVLDKLFTKVEMYINFV